LTAKEKRTKKEKPFNVSLTLHWASLRSLSMNTGGTAARNAWNLARAFWFQLRTRLWVVDTV